MSALAEQPLHSRAFPPNGNSNTSNGNGNGSTGTGTGTGTGGHARPHTHATHASVPSSDGGDGYGDPSTGEGDEREDGDGGNESSDSELAATQDGQATKAKRKRKNVSRACDRCRERKIKCSGDEPTCKGCDKSKKQCVYRAHVDGRMTDKSAKRKFQTLHMRIRQLEAELADALKVANAVPGQAAKSGSGSADGAGDEGQQSGASGAVSRAAHAATVGSPLVDTNLAHPPTTAPPRDYGRSDPSMADRPDCQPFGTGRLVLSQTGNLHLYPAATFYSPAYLAPDWQRALEALVPRPPSRPGYLSPYLPFPLDPVHHRRLIDLCFDRMWSFGMNVVADKFLDEMAKDPVGRGLYFSPMAHLAVLAVGWRYFKDPAVGMYYAQENVGSRGNAFAQKALERLWDEVADPRMSTIFALITLSIYHTGMQRECVEGHVSGWTAHSSSPVASSLYSMAMNLAQDWRLHRRCDQQLAELGLGVDSELDIARRDVYGAATNLSCWYATYVGQDPLPLRDQADQRLPYIRRDLFDPVERDISEMFHYHVALSDLGLQALHCNHTLRAPLEQRVARVRTVWEGLDAWRRNLPENQRWPPAEGRKLHPALVTNHGMFATYVIILFRPYIIEIAHSTSIHAQALRECLSCAADVVAQSKYIERTYGSITTAPMSWQHILYVCGTMLVLQASGLPTVSDEDKAQAFVDLAYLQTAMEEIAYVWPWANHTRSSLRQLLQAAHR